MDHKDDELLSAQYKIEKASVKQQKLEDNLDSLSKDLKKNKRNSFLFLLFFFLFFAGLIGAVLYYWKINDLMLFKPASTIENDDGTISNDILKVNDSLKEELQKLKTEVADFKQIVIKADSVSDSTSLGTVTEKDSLLSSSKSRFEDKKNIKGEKRYCYIDRVFSQDETAFIEADYLDYYEGKKAVTMAKENGDAEFDVSKEGDTVYFLYNDYYISNQNTRTRILELDANIKIRGINQISNGFSFKAFEGMIQKQPLFEIKVDNGIVYEIKEQKLP